MAGERVKKNGESMYVISPSVTGETRDKVKRMVLAYDGTMASTLRVAIEFGLGIMEREAKKYENLDESRYSDIRNKVMSDGRRIGKS